MNSDTLMKNTFFNIFHYLLIITLSHWTACAIVVDPNQGRLAMLDEGDAGNNLNNTDGAVEDDAGTQPDCTPPEDPLCDDNTPCTTDTCSSDMMCVHTPVDSDHDGYPAKQILGNMCAGGTDCNDATANVHPGASELCDGVDSNCNGLSDGADNCPADTCANASMITLTNNGTARLSGNFSFVDSDHAVCAQNMPDIAFRVQAPMVGCLFVNQARNGEFSADVNVWISNNDCSTTGLSLCNQSPLNFQNGLAVTQGEFLTIVVSAQNELSKQRSFRLDINFGKCN